MSDHRPSVFRVHAGYWRAECPDCEWVYSTTLDPPYAHRELITAAVDHHVFHRDGMIIALQKVLAARAAS